MASATLPAKVKTSKALVDDDEYEGPSRSTVVTVLALLVGVLSLIDYFLHGFGPAVAHLAYFGGVFLVFRLFLGLALGGSDSDADPEPDPSP
ncbi:hypothetical protein [Streptomyces sp. H27-C3]|uniref:hypothetical protein n=1 Tax=Streptomyces sp. H27-C3 TaxID=3046305 RepID=UPI0024B8D533|nr:hypothetical protein [Streptomyces sp. H27-C3]MDJ0465034.1 hypothetical protein [Streptomyces sp. H27-C3]